MELRTYEIIPCLWVVEYWSIDGKRFSHAVVMNACETNTALTEFKGDFR